MATLQKTTPKKRVVNNLQGSTSVVTDTLPQTACVLFEIYKNKKKELYEGNWQRFTAEVLFNHFKAVSFV